MVARGRSAFARTPFFLSQSRSVALPRADFAPTSFESGRGHRKRRAVWRNARTSRCRAARDRINPRSIARREIATDVIATRDYRLPSPSSMWPTGTEYLESTRCSWRSRLCPGSSTNGGRNRLSAPDLFLEELATSFDTLGDTPLGRPGVQSQGFNHGC